MMCTGINNIIFLYKKKTSAVNRASGYGFQLTVLTFKLKPGSPTIEGQLDFFSGLQFLGL